MSFLRNAGSALGVATQAISILFSNKKYERTSINPNIENQPEGAAISGIEIDAVFNEDHRYTSKATIYPVESGLFITDSIYNLPTRVTLSGVVTDTPLNFLSAGNRSVSAFNKLVNLHKSRTPVTLITGVKRYENMVMLSLSVPITVQTGQSLTFNMEFQEIIYAGSKGTRTRQTVTTRIGGFINAINRDQVSSNSLLPPAQSTDPSNTLKDQASTGINAGIQGLIYLTPPVQNNVLINLSKLGS